MNARRMSVLPQPSESAAPIPTTTDADAAVDIEQAREHIATTALHPAPAGRVGLELEYHVVDVRSPRRRPTWDEITALVADVGRPPCGSAITVEPGGQLELSGPPYADVVTAVGALERDQAALRAAAARRGLGLASIGADPARQPARITPVQRYAAMEQHFDALGCGTPGRRMMASTAALQVNVDAGTPEQWADRVEHVHRIGPVLSALAACSPMLAGRASGWSSMREQAWRGIDASRSAPMRRSTDPAAAWADYALSASVMLRRDGDHATPIEQPTSLAQWLADPSLLGRPATVADVDYHLTTLFPPVRLRGYLELRFLDAVPDTWWPALSAVTVTLIDDPIAADHAAEACTAVVGAWNRAARDGLRDPALSEAARRCVAIAAARCPTPLRADVERYAESVTQGRSPGDALRSQIAALGPESALAAYAVPTTEDRDA